MLKYSFILIGIYFLYYAGNIVYDLFLKKEKTLATDESEEFSLISFARTENPPESRIEIEDVENIRAPKSFLKSEVHPIQNSASAQEQTDLEELRKRFEAEEDLDGDIPKTEFTEEITDSAIKEEEAEQAEKEILAETEEEVKSETDQEKEVQMPKPPLQEENEQYWKKMVSLAQTSIKLVKNYEGEKVYHSTQ